MNDVQSTIVGLKAEACPGGGWNGMPRNLEGRATVADCLANGVCGCTYGNAVQHIERLRAALIQIRVTCDGNASPSCNKSMALAFVGEIAGHAINQRSTDKT